MVGEDDDVLRIAAEPLLPPPDGSDPLYASTDFDGCHASELMVPDTGMRWHTRSLPRDTLSQQLKCCTYQGNVNILATTGKPFAIKRKINTA